MQNYIYLSGIKQDFLAHSKDLHSSYRNKNKTFFGRWELCIQILKGKGCKQFSWSTTEKWAKQKRRIKQETWIRPEINPEILKWKNQHKIKKRWAAPTTLELLKLGIREIPFDYISYAAFVTKEKKNLPSLNSVSASMATLKIVSCRNEPAWNIINALHSAPSWRN